MSKLKTALKWIGFLALFLIVLAIAEGSSDIVRVAIGMGIFIWLVAYTILKRLDALERRVNAISAKVNAQP